MKYDVVALGELLIDFTGSGLSDRGNLLFEANPGGAPGNVLAMLSKLGRNTAFIGKVGNDFFGRGIIDTLGQLGIDTGAISRDSHTNTTLAFVNNKADGDREFTFFRNPGADTQLDSLDVPYELLQNTSIFHFGSLSLTHEPSRGATRIAVTAAEEYGALISFDPNLRPLLWEAPVYAQRQMEWGCGVCDILKISDEEAEFLTDCKDTRLAAERLRLFYPNIRIIFITKGKSGSEGYWGDVYAEQPAFINEDTIDTTGAGDTFLGCCLSMILDLDIGKPDAEALNSMLIYANAAASLITTKQGALCSMPEKEGIEKLISDAAIVQRV
ncbi:MAG: carbohydrate kinase [Clostridiales Family XIII bacterium]|jgi:fructokinase|nr:carbohydrate kinase [Clostridiales Family XIII bacterium]